MSTERRKVLEMLAEGKITAEEAEKLLEKLSSVESGSRQSESNATGAKPEGEKPLRYLRVQVEKPGRQDVNMRIPLNFARVGLGVILSRHDVVEKLNDSGVDVHNLSGLRGQELEEVLKQLHIDVEEGSGKKVRIFCE